MKRTLNQKFHYLLTRILFLATFLLFSFSTNISFSQVLDVIDLRPSDYQGSCFFDSNNYALSYYASQVNNDFDFNNDGQKDFISIHTIFDYLYAYRNIHRVAIYSGTNKKLLHDYRINGYRPERIEFIKSINHDPLLLLSYPEQSGGKVELHDIRSKSIISTYSYQNYAQSYTGNGLAVEDFNMDGVQDFAYTTNPGIYEDNSSDLIVRSGIDREILCSLPLNQTYYADIVKVSDVNDDGVPDLAAVASVNNSEIIAFADIYNCEWIGYIDNPINVGVNSNFRISSIGDITGDEIQELMLSEKYKETSLILNGYTFESIRTTPYHERYKYSNTNFDLNKDGKSEVFHFNKIFTGSNNNLLGKTYELINNQFPGIPDRSWNVEFVSKTNDRNNDGVDDLIVSAYSPYIANTTQCAEYYLFILDSNSLLKPELNTSMKQNELTPRNSFPFSIQPQIAGVPVEGDFYLKYNSNEFQFNDNGVNGDLKANDGIYTTIISSTPNDLFAITGEIYGAFQSDGTHQLSKYDITFQPRGVYENKLSTYSWYIPNSGSQIPNFGSSYEIRKINLPYSFNYFGDNYSTINISTAGYITFGNSSINVPNTNERLPTAKSSNAGIFPLWGNLSPNSKSKVYVDNVGSGSEYKTYITFEGFRLYSEDDFYSSSIATFQVILDQKTQQITFQYKKIYSGNPTTNKGGLSTAGIQAGRFNGITLAHLDNKFSDETSFAFGPVSNGQSVTPTPTATPTPIPTLNQGNTGSGNTSSNKIRVVINPTLNSKNKKFTVSISGRSISDNSSKSLKGCRSSIYGFSTNLKTKKVSKPSLLFSINFAKPTAKIELNNSPIFDSSKNADKIALFGTVSCNGQNFTPSIIDSYAIKKTGSNKKGLKASIWFSKLKKVVSSKKGVKIR
jgi:hypothetical protein